MGLTRRSDAVCFFSLPPQSFRFVLYGLVVSFRGPYFHVSLSFRSCSVSCFLSFRSVYFVFGFVSHLACWCLFFPNDFGDPFFERPPDHTSLLAGRGVRLVALTGTCRLLALAATLPSPLFPLPDNHVTGTDKVQLSMSCLM